VVIAGGTDKIEAAVSDCCWFCADNGSAEVAYRAQQLLEHSLLSELRAIVARALSGLDMFAGGQLSELDLLGSDFLENSPAEQARCLRVANI
jgi:hypothetical protein